MRLGEQVGVILSLLFSCAGFCAEQAAWQPSAGHTQVPIWPRTALGAQRDAGPEEDAVTVTSGTGELKLVAGKPWIAVRGGYNILAIDLEGTEVCDWLTSKGITCVLLKYRVPCVKLGPYRNCPMALEDAQRTVGLVRFHAAEWHIDPHRIGVLGFSAGGHMAAAMSTHFAKRLYPAVDAADTESCRPDFAVALYPGHLAVPETDFALNPDIQVSSHTPPTFLLQAEDDPVDPAIGMISK